MYKSHTKLATYSRKIWDNTHIQHTYNTHTLIDKFKSVANNNHQDRKQYQWDIKLLKYFYCAMQMHPHVPPCILRQPLPWHRHDGCYEVLPSWSPDIRTAGLSHLSFCNHRLTNAWRSFKQVMPNICCSMYIFLTSSVWFSKNNNNKKWSLTFRTHFPQRNSKFSSTHTKSAFCSLS